MTDQTSLTRSERQQLNIAVAQVLGWKLVTPADPFNLYLTLTDLEGVRRFHSSYTDSMDDAYEVWAWLKTKYGRLGMEEIQYVDRPNYIVWAKTNLHQETTDLYVVSYISLPHAICLAALEAYKGENHE